jgi:2-dehydro-3-deoxyphosphogluconate aldolase / (4S)-4-hydroxy-2-oxoglutarate aldolase
MELLDLLRAGRLLAIVRGTAAGAALRTVLTLAEHGVTAVEVSLTTPDATGVLRQARDRLGPDFALGAGTVLSAVDAARAVDAGAGFLVTPGTPDDLRAAGVPLLLGALTPTEVVTAVRRGATAVKLFPASLGGPAHLRALRDPFPDVPFVPVGGVDADRAREHLAAGAVAVGVGGPLIGDAASGGDLAALPARIAAFRAAIA